MIKVSLSGTVLLFLWLLLQSNFAYASVPSINDYNLTSGTVDQGDFKLYGNHFSSQYKPSDGRWAFYALHRNYADILDNFAPLQRSEISPKISKADGFRAIKLNAHDASYVRTSLDPETRTGTAGIALKGIVGSTGYNDYYVYLKIFLPELPTSPVSIFHAGTGANKIELRYSPNSSSGATLTYTHGSGSVVINDVFIQPGQWYALEIKRVAEINHLTIQNMQGSRQTASRWADGFEAGDEQPFYFGKGQGSLAYFDGYMRDLIIRRRPLPEDDIARVFSLHKTTIKMRNKASGQVSLHDEAILSVCDESFYIRCGNRLLLSVPRTTPGDYDLSVLTINGESNVIPFTVKPLRIERQAFVENFTDPQYVQSRWVAAHKAWGGANGGVSYENIALQSENGEVVITAHGDDYTGTVSGVDRQGYTVPRITRVGGSLVSRKYFGPGEFIIEATIPPRTGVASAFWLIHYEEGYPGHPLFDEMLAEGLHVSGSQELGFYTVRNHEIDIEFPTALKTDADVEDVSLFNGRFNTWHGELRNWDVPNNDILVSDPNYTPVNDPAYWSEYTDDWINHGINVADGEFHEYRIKWMLDDGAPYVEFYIDGTLIKRIETHVPYMPQKLWMGMWFPSGKKYWAGRDASWDSQRMKIRRFEYIPEATVGASYVVQGETYPIHCFRNIPIETTHKIIGDFNGDGIPDVFSQAENPGGVSTLSPQSGCMIDEIHRSWTGAHPDIAQIPDWSASQYTAYSGNFNANPGDELLLLGKTGNGISSNAIVSWNKQYSANRTVFNLDVDVNPDDFDVHTGNLTGNGYDEIFLQRKWHGGVSYIFNNQGGLEQTIQDRFLNIDWSATSYSAHISNRNIVLTPLTSHQYAFAGQTYQFKPTSTTHTNSNVTYSATGMPAWMTINSTTGEISGTPNTNDAGRSYPITITARDETATDPLKQALISLNVNVESSFTISQTDYTVYEAPDGTLYLVSDNGEDYYKIISDNGTDVILKISSSEFDAASNGLAVNYRAVIKDFNNDESYDLVLESLVSTMPDIVIRDLTKGTHSITRGDTFVIAQFAQEPIITPQIMGHFDALELGRNGIRGWAYDPNDPDRSVDVRLYVNDSNEPLITILADNEPNKHSTIPADISGRHDFALTIPEDMETDITAKVDAYAVDSTGAEVLIGTRYVITVRTGHDSAYLSDGTNFIATDENGDFTAWNIPVNQTYTIAASDFPDFSACFSPEILEVRTTGVLNDVVFNEVSCSFFDNSDFAHYEVDYKSELPGMAIVRVNPMLNGGADSDSLLDAYASGWAWNFETRLSNPTNTGIPLLEVFTSTLHDMGNKAALRFDFDNINNLNPGNYDRGIFYRLNFDTDFHNLTATLEDLTTNTTSIFTRAFMPWTGNPAFQRLASRTFRDGTTIIYEYEHDDPHAYCDNLRIRHEPSGVFMSIERELLNGARGTDARICAPIEITLPDGISKIVYQWEHYDLDEEQDFSANPRLKQVTYPDGSIRQYVYADEQRKGRGIPRLSQVVDEEGRVEVNFNWNGKFVTRRYAGTVSEPQDELAIERNLDGSRIITGMGDGIVRTQHFTEWVNAAGVNFKRMSGLSDPCSWCANDAKAIEYNDIGLATRIISQRDVVTDIIRDTNDPMQREISRIIGAGTHEARTIHTAYHPQLNLPIRTEEVDNSGSRVITETTYNDKGLPTLVRLTDSTQTLSGSQATVVKEVALQYTEHSNGQIATVTIDGPWSADGTNDVTVLGYDSLGLLLYETNNLGTTHYQNFDGLGRARRIVHPNGTTTERTFNWKGQVLTSITAGVEIRYSYYKNGLLKSETTPGSNETTTYTYDAANRLHTVTDNAGNRREITYDAAGRQILVTESDSADGSVDQSFSFQYNDTDRTVTSFPTDFNNQKQIGYFNEDFQRTRLIDEMSKTTILTRDALGRVVRSQNNASGLINESTFDVSDNVRSSVYSGPEGQTRSQLFRYTTDANAAIWELQDADTGTDTLLRDLAGNIVDESNNSGGNRITGTYDAFDRITQYNIVDPGTGQVLDTVDYHYDQNPDGSTPAPIGLLTQISGSLGEVKYFYDAVGNLIRKTQSHDQNDYSDAYGYDNANRLTTMTYPSGRQVEFVLNEIGKPGAIMTRTAQGNWINVADQISYAPFDNVEDAETLRYGGTQIATRSHDTAGRIESFSDGEQTVHVEYRADSLVSALRAASGNTIASYTYGASNRLKSASGEGFNNQQFIFESTGDLKSITDTGSAARILSYLDNTSRLVVFADESLDYVQDGLVSRQGDLNLTYNSRGLIATAQKDSGMVYHYAYDPLGQRQSKTAANGEVTHYHYDIADRLIAESNPTTGETLIEYIWLGERPLMIIIPATATQAEVHYYIHSDYSNTPVRLTDTTGQTVWHWQRNPFGSNAPAVEQITFNLRLPGQYYDAESGLHYNGARYYNPSTGRYLQPDPVGEAAGISAYTYANGDPVNFTDPTGLMPVGGSTSLPGITVTATRLPAGVGSALWGGFSSGDPYFGPQTDFTPASEENVVLSEIRVVASPIKTTGQFKVIQAIVNAVKNLLFKKKRTKTVDDLKKDSKPGRDTKGRTEQRERSGGFDQANKDFDALNPENVKDIETDHGPGRTGTLPDGRNVTVRPGSSEGRPTLEIRNPGNKRGIEIRFND